jgi:hypothetical protein
MGFHVVFMGGDNYLVYFLFFKDPFQKGYELSSHFEFVRKKQTLIKKSAWFFAFFSHIRYYFINSNTALIRIELVGIVTR